MSDHPRTRRAVRIAALAAAATGVLPLHAAHQWLVRDAARGELRERYQRAWCGAMLRLFGITAVVHGDVPPRGTRGLLVVANHRSAIDIVLLFRIFGGHMLSRSDVSAWPVLGALSRRIGTVFVDRSSRRSGAAAIRTMTGLLAAKRTVAAFPEGTTFEGDEVRPFHRGAFFAACRAGADVLPVGVAYPLGSEAAYRNETFPSHLARVAAAPASEVHVALGLPILYEAARPVAATAELARARVSDAVRVARRGTGGGTS